jgi:hypothetical protein
MKSLYIAWQDPETRLWHTVGQLNKQNDSYSFAYTKGALASPRFKYLGRMRDLHQRYVSRELFPLFSNRVLSSSRPEYPDYVRWLAVEPDQDDPMQLLARSGGRRATDELCVYPHPEANADGEIELFFLSHGLRHLSQSDLQYINGLKIGDRLLLRPEDENAKDRFALRLETGEPATVGYCPRYLNRDLRRVLDQTDVQITVERLNVDAPIQFRLLCRAALTLPAGFDFFAGDEYLPLDQVAVAA